MTLPKRVEIETSWTTPDTPMKTTRKAPSNNRTGTGPTAKRKKAAPAAVSKPAKKRKRARTSWTLGPLSAVREGTGGARPEPTPNAITPASVCPSSESTRHRTV